MRVRSSLGMTLVPAALAAITLGSSQARKGLDERSAAPPAYLQVETPTFVPDGGAYAAGQVITIETATSGATIRYTLNGADPTSSDPVVPAGGVIVGNYTLKARAFKAGDDPSAVKSAGYTTTSALHAGRLAAGVRHAAVVRSDGTVWSFGANDVGQLGVGTTGPERGLPNLSAGLTGVVAASAGYDFVLAVRADGTAWAWGSNASGQLGDGTTASRATPYQVPLTGSYVAVATGESHSLAVRSDGTVWAWGSNSNGQLGDGTTTPRTSPVQVPALSGVVAVSAGRWHSHALKADGTVWGWGYSAQGQVGDGYTTQRTSPVQVDGLTSVTAISSAAGAGHTVALRDDGTVWVWGSNQFGQAGDGGTVDHLTPGRAMSLTVPAVAVAAGASHTLAIADELAFAWGHGGSGQLGNGGTAHSYVAVQIPSPTDVVAIGASGMHSHAVTEDGSVWSWGYGGNGQVGDGRRVDTLAVRAA